MNKRLSLALFITLLLSLGIYTLYTYSTKAINAKNFIKTVSEENKYGFDSLNNAIKNENELNQRIKNNIDSGNFKTAYSLMASLPDFGKTETIYLYRGMIYEKQQKFSEAIKEYSALINIESLPLALGKRADLYIKLNKFNLALDDYMHAYYLNYDYSLKVASTFDLINKKDSSLKYYKIYLDYYPNDSLAREKFNSLLK